MGLALEGERGAEANRCNADGNPAELVGDSNNTVIRLEGVMDSLGRRGRMSYFWSHDHSWPAPMKLAPKQRPLIRPVKRTATQGTLFLFNLPKTPGACPSIESVYINLAPANRAWLPADRTLVMITALMKLPATCEPTIWKTIVKGDVRVFLVLRPGYVCGTFRPMRSTERILAAVK